MEKTVVLGKGIGSINFGSSKDDILAKLGPADEIEKISFEEEGGGVAEVWHYDDEELSFSFEEEYDWMLTSIACSSPETSFEGSFVVDMEKGDLLAFLTKNGFQDVVNEDISEEDTDEELISSDEKSINFWMQDGLLREVQFGPFIDEEGEYQFD